jgi:hypothetical protein
MGKPVVVISENIAGSISDIAYFENRIYVCNNSYVHKSNATITEWELDIPIVGFYSPVMIVFDNNLYLASGQNGNYDLYVLNATRDGFDYVCGPSDTDYWVKNFIIHDNTLFACLAGIQGQLLRFTGVDWESVGVYPSNLNDGVSLDGTLYLGADNGAFIIWDGLSNFVLFGTPCSNSINRLCVKEGIFYAGTNEGELFLFNADTEIWDLVCNSISDDAITTDLLVYRDRVYAAVWTTSNDGLLLRDGVTNWENIFEMGSRSYNLLGKMHLLIEGDTLYLGTEDLGEIYRYSSIESVDFSSDKIADLAPVTVNFSYIGYSDFPVTSYSWNFEDGYYSSEENPTHTFIRGTYKITLEISNGIESDLIEKYNYIDSYTLNTFFISTIEQLQAIGSPGDAVSGTMGFALHDTYIQTTNIDASITTTWNGGLGFRPIAYYPLNAFSITNVFTGVFNGGGHSISSLFMNRPTEEYVALFQRIDSAALSNIRLLQVDITGLESSAGLCGVRELITTNICTIDNCEVTGSLNSTGNSGGLIGFPFYVNVKDCNVAITIDATGASNIGGLGGFCQETTFDNCHSRSNLTGTDYIGGLVGVLSTGDIKNCSFIGDINSSTYIGGIAGYLYNADVDNCYSNGIITYTHAGYVGGLLGYCVNDKISNCYSTCTFVDDTTPGASNFYGMGGLVGYHVAYTFGSAIVNNCYSTSDIKGTYYVGGLFGRCEANISNSYSTGNLSIDLNNDFSQNFGGLCGQHIGAVIACYATGDVIGSLNGSYIGGLIGSQSVYSGLPEGIVDSYSTGSVFGGTYTGGLVGYAYIDMISNCYTTSNVVCENTGSAGGFAGYASSTSGAGTITLCFVFGTITDNANLGDNIGGFGGYVNGFNFERCFSIGNIENGSSRAGGFIGYAEGSDCEIVECCAFGNVISNNGGHCGGFIGESHISITDCFARGDVSNLALSHRYTGGFIGQHFCTDTQKVNNCYSVGLVSD